MTGGRIKRIYDHICNEDMFFLTYGDGLSNVNINKLKDFHISHGKKANLMAAMLLVDLVFLILVKIIQINFQEPSGDLGKINGAFLFYHQISLNILKMMNQFLKASLWKI